MSYLRLLPAFVCVASSVATHLLAQQPVRGTVVAAVTADTLPFSIVSLEPGFAPRLTDARGRFTFPDVPSGTYRLVVRQIGHVRFDTTLTVGSEGLVLRVTLRRVAIGLPPVTVRGTIECRVPGAPDPNVSPAAAAVFEQAVENARRYGLLADSFPHRSTIERTQAQVDAHGRQRVTKVDTVARESHAWRPYRPGRLVADGVGKRLGELEVRMWSLVDFADSVFVRNHCFRLAGRDTLAGETFIRLDFQPPKSLGMVDVEGAAYLDSITYVVRHTVVRLTQPRQSLHNVADLVTRQRFRLVAPWIVVYDRLSAVTRLRSPRGAERIEELRLLDVHFWRPLEQDP